MIVSVLALRGSQNETLVTTRNLRDCFLIPKLEDHNLLGIEVNQTKSAASIEDLIIEDGWSGGW